MKLELKRVDPLRAANIGALVYGLLSAVFVLIFSPFFLLAALIAPSREAGLAGPFLGLFLLIFYPVMGFVVGWISGLLSCAIYNLIVRWSGGLLMELDGAFPGGDASSRQTASV